MLETFSLIMRLRIATKTNSTINWLRTTPIIKHIIPRKLYQSEGLKGFLEGLSYFREFCSIFFYKIIYYLIVLGLAGFAAKGFSEKGVEAYTVNELFMTVLVFWPIVGVVTNTGVFDMDEDTYYAIFLLKMNARDYMLSQFIFKAIKYVVGTLIVLLVMGCLFMGIPFYQVFCYVIYGESLKWAYTGFEVWYRDKYIGNKKADTNLMGIRVLVTLLPFAAGYIIMLNKAVPGIVFLPLAVVSLILAIFSGIRMWNFKGYRRVFKYLLRPEVLIENRQAMKNANLINAANSIEGAESIMDLDGKKIKKTAKKVNKNITSNKEGYAYFNDLFMKRHRKILMKPAIIYSIIIAALFLISFAVILYFEDFRGQLNDFLLTKMTVFLFVMYAMNTGKKTTEAMFANCDNAMLNYRFYRQPKTILGLFTGRLKYVIYTNLIPAFLLALSLLLLFVASGGSDQMLDYIVIPLLILVMSVFFSTHNLVLYYVFQPYTSDSTVKNPVYGIVHYITYMVCYLSMMEIKASSAVFCTGVIAFSVAYIIVALIVVYRIAPKTFKLRK